MGFIMKGRQEEERERKRPRESTERVKEREENVLSRKVNDGEEQREIMVEAVKSEEELDEQGRENRERG